MSDVIKRKILIVEDEAIQIKVLAQRFLDEGYLVVTSIGGDQGLETALREKPELIILDNMLPVMTGAALVQKLRKHDEWGQKVPVIFFTNAELNKEEYRHVHNSATAFLLKSDTNLFELVEKVREMLPVV